MSGARMSSTAAVSNSDAWTKSHRPQADALILQHVDLVRRIAYHMKRRIPRNIEVDDLIQTGMVGLLEAAQRYKSDNGASFASYATRRIRGAMLDSLRRADSGSRSLRRRLRGIEGAKLRIEGKTGEPAKAPAIAESIGMTLENYFRAMHDFSQSTQISLDESSPGAESPCEDVRDGKAGPDEELEHGDLLRAVAEAIAALPFFERIILVLYYDQDFLMREIGVRFTVSESRICQIHKRAIERLRAATQ
jgi:RNA polymerase sigma factor FliA